MPVPNDGFMEEPKHVACFGQQKIMSANAVVTYSVSLSLSI
jgi:hypothetical protein